MSSFPRCAILTLVLLSGCVSFQWVRDRSFREVPLAASQQLVVNESTLGDCLAVLGAPHLVSEAAGGSLWLVWAWSDTTDWGLNVSVPLARFFSASVSYGQIDAAKFGLALRMDGGLRLREMRRGRLSTILTDERTGPKRRRPASKS